MGQYCFFSLASVVCRLSSSVGVCNTHGQPAGGFSSAGQAMTSCRLHFNYSSTVTLHGGPVRLRPVSATPCIMREWWGRGTGLVIWCYMGEER